MSGSTTQRAPKVRTFEYPDVATETLPASFRNLWGPRLAGAALVLDMEETLELSAEVSLVFSAMKRILMSHGRVERYMASVGITGRRAELLKQFSTANVDSYLRADLYLTADGWRILEMNVASDLGLLDQFQVAELVARSAHASRLHLQTVASAQFVRDAILRRLDQRSRAPRCVVAVPSGKPDEFTQIVASTADALTRSGLPTEVRELGDFSLVDDELWLHGSRVDVVLRYFHVDDLLDDAVFESAQPILSAMNCGTVLVWSSPNSSLLSNKGALALLWEWVDTGKLSQDASDAVRRLVPRTTYLPSGDLSAATRIALTRDRPRIVVKPATGSSGIGVACGWEENDSRWISSVEAAAESHGAIVQERVDSLTFQLGNESTAEYAVVWGLFVVDGVFAGMATRAQPVTDGAVIGFQGHPAAIVSPVLFSGTRPAPNAHLFVYGTLMFPDVLLALLGRVPDALAWTIPGWRRVTLRDRAFPGLVPGEDHDSTDGLLLLGITDAERRLLRDYEGPMYELAVMGGGPNGTEVASYICVDEDLTRGQPVWLPQSLSRESLAEYLERIRAWKATRPPEESRHCEPSI